MLKAAEVHIIHQNVKITLERLQKLRPKSPHCVVMFLGGNLPGKALYHLRVLSLFGMIARLPESMLNKIAYYQLVHAKPSSDSWFMLVRELCLKYGLPSPLSLLNMPIPKLQYKRLVKSKVIDFWEKLYRSEASQLNDRSLKYFNPAYMSLTRSGRPVHQIRMKFTKHNM